MPSFFLDSMGEMKFYQMRHGLHNNKTHDLDLYTYDITLNEIIITAMIQLDNTGHLRKSCPHYI